MQREVPPTFDLLHDPESLLREVSKLSPAIDEWGRQVLSETGKPIMALCVLRGGVLFFSDLAKACAVSLELAFCRARSYSSQENATQLDTIETTFFGTDFEGRDVLMVDDICDSGRTLRHLEEELLSKKGARSVRTVTLVYREREDSVFQPDWHALAYSGDEWLVGYGMEDCNRYMNYPSLYRIKPTTDFEI